MSGFHYNLIIAETDKSVAIVLFTKQHGWSSKCLKPMFFSLSFYQWLVRQEPILVHFQIMSFQLFQGDSIGQFCMISQPCEIK